MNLEIPKQFQNNTVAHSFAGNDYVVVEAATPDHSRIVMAGKGQLADRAFLAWNRCLAVEKPIGFCESGPVDEELKKRVTELRSDLKRGKKVVKVTHIVPA